MTDKEVTIPELVTDIKIGDEVLYQNVYDKVHNGCLGKVISIIGDDESTLYVTLIHEVSGPFVISKSYLRKLTKLDKALK